jgi:hypothetical protein
MKPTSFSRAIFPALALGFTALLPAVAADVTNAATNPAPPPSALDNDEMTQLVKARAQVLAANPDLKAEEVKLKTMHDAMGQNPSATAEQKNAAFAEWKAYQKKMRAAMLKIDPTLEPIFTKLDESRKHGGEAPFQPAAAK